MERQTRRRLLTAAAKLVAALTVLATATAGYLDARTEATTAQRAIATERAAADAAWSETAGVVGAMRERIAVLEHRLGDLERRKARRDARIVRRAETSTAAIRRLPRARPKPKARAVEAAYQQIQQRR